MRRLGRRFYSRYTPDVARDMVGAILVRELDGVVTSGRIVETEAYRGADDPASHAYRGRTRRTEVMFGEAGHAYVYFTYGFHYCLNATTETRGSPGAVLIRAIEPIEGVEVMRERRGVEGLRQLTDGPGKLTKAMGIDLALNGEDMVVSRKLYLCEGDPAGPVETSVRVGVSVGRETPWRFFLVDNPFVSRGGTHNYAEQARGAKKGSSARSQ